ncbi:MAG: HD domain-containing protein [Spirochaetes bacterium]|jgi:hypothetical protein|nr:HD domain-containing protein [Spirochaetota bacterium]
MYNEIMMDMINYFEGDVARVNHSLKVYSFASLIAGMEGVASDSVNVVHYASILHDIGIILAQKKHNSTAGKYQEIEGPAVARSILHKYKIDEETIERVCFIVGNHHSYTKIDGIDFQIIVEADFLVNVDEDKASRSAVESIYNKYFQTETGKKIFKELYLNKNGHS